MRKVFCLLAFIFCGVKSNSQCSLVTEKTNGICYLGMDNPLRVCIANSSTKEIELKTVNGKISKVSDEGLFIYHPNLLGKAIIKVYKKGKEIASYHFIVENIHLSASVGFKNSGDTLTKDFFVSQVKLSVSLPSMIMTCDVIFIIEEFSMLVFRGDSLLFNIKNTGTYFNKDITKTLAELNKNDKLIFYNILAGTPRGKEMLNPIEYCIK